MRCSYVITFVEFVRTVVLYALVGVHIVVGTVGCPCGLNWANLGLKDKPLHKIYRLLWNSY